MRPLLLPLFALLVLVALPALDYPGEYRLYPADDEAELRRLKGHDWPAAYRNRDTLLLGRILADEFVVVDADGQAATKRDELDYLKKSAHVTYESFDYTIERLRVYGQTALVAGTGRSRGRTEKGTFRTMYHSTNLFVRREGRWQAVASHLSGIKQLP
ncbi:MAG: nuclear transport factor 2 family protein [Cytophagales bacterium]|nr:nuclear transport factor 2 family protein [Cytophagales bacterium]